MDIAHSLDSLLDFLNEYHANESDENDSLNDIILSDEDDV